ncbi:NADH:flavin oxidoreductase/NADH oxidase [Moelleriella libera RCEF 2490]|uniref:NADH:flavin oxidoreductase/NADH oxidase n=1 Tax=Moelleriella libera RCEF 2490 TaxID=1081109 RepID=A0A162IQB3_9HYPO|nr:NADH:flavin oxidoreductase/NADH oxidase [Moelleriella libera RCEF 2490]
MPASKNLWPSPSSTPLNGSKLFSSLQLGKLALKHRVVQAPTTRMRCDADSSGVSIPGPRLAKYYGDRATDGGLQITEATDISLYASGYPGVPGVFTERQLEGWRDVTDSVHAKGGYLFVQLWHTGRASSASMRGGQTPLSSGDAPMSGHYLDGTECKSEPPRAMTTEEIRAVTREWAAAAKRSVDEAGFDGVEIHSGNGYLLEQFLHDNINQRTDEYGGSVENRCRFTVEVVKAVCDAIGAERVGVRLSPYNYFQDTRDSDPDAHWTFLCSQLAGLPSKQRLLYVHMVEPRFDEVLNEEQKMASLQGAGKERRKSLTNFRNVLQAGDIRFIACGNFNRENSVVTVENDAADLIAFGRHFIANPDLVARLKNGWGLNEYDRATFYGAEPKDKGYNDYPFYDGDDA